MLLCFPEILHERGEMGRSPLITGACPSPNRMGHFVHPFRAPLPSPGPSLYDPNGCRKYLTATERRLFIAAAETAPPLVRSFCLTLVHCGFRLSEALSLTTADVELDGGWIAVRCLKKRGVMKVRQVPAPSALLRDLAGIHALPSSAARYLWPWHRTRAWQLVKEVMANAGISQLPAASPKGLRHTFGTHAVLSGVPLPLVQRWLGHANIKTTAIYTDVIGQEERQIAGRMWDRSDCCKLAAI